MCVVACDIYYSTLMHVYESDRLLNRCVCSIALFISCQTPPSVLLLGSCCSCFCRYSTSLSNLLHQSCISACRPGLPTLLDDIRCHDAPTGVMSRLSKDLVTRHGNLATRMHT